MKFRLYQRLVRITPARQMMWNLLMAVLYWLVVLIADRYSVSFTITFIVTTVLIWASIGFTFLTAFVKLRNDDKLPAGKKKWLSVIAGILALAVLSAPLVFMMLTGKP